jgi:hypothetical protein
MKHRKFLILFTILPWLLLTPLVFAHVPIGPGDNESLNTATVIPDPAKSWAIYGELHEGGEVQYYRFEITENQRIYISLFISTNPEESGFVPSLVLMGPEISNKGDLPDFVEAPESVNVMIIEGKHPDQAYYEGFSPSSQYFVAKVDMDAPASGTYYIAVYEPNQGGHYGLAVGYQETFTLLEWIRVPIDQISIYQWSGQSLALILAPMTLTVAIGLVIMIWWRVNRETLQTLFGLVGSVAGFFFIGSGASVLFQMFFNLTRVPLTPEIGVTLIFALLPIILGIISIRITFRSEETEGVQKRISMVILGVIAFFIWAGLLIGPVLAIIAGVLPFITERVNTLN